MGGTAVCLGRGVRGRCSSPSGRSNQRAQTVRWSDRRPCARCRRLRSAGSVRRGPARRERIDVVGCAIDGTSSQHADAFVLVEPPVHGDRLLKCVASHDDRVDARDEFVPPGEALGKGSRKSNEPSSRAMWPSIVTASITRSFREQLAGAVSCSRRCASV